MSPQIFFQTYKYVKICYTNSFLIFVVILIYQVKFSQMTLTTAKNKFNTYQHA